MAQAQARATRIRVLTQDTSCAGSVQVTATTEFADLREDAGDYRRRKQVSQPMPPSQGRVAPVAFALFLCGGSRGSTAEERRLSQRASSESQGGRASQSELSGIPIS